MNTLSMNWIWVTIVIPVLAISIKAELGKLLATYTAFKRKAFEVGSRVQLFNGAAGAWGGVVTVERYIFSLSSAKRGVYIAHDDGGLEKVPILEWQSWRKRSALKKKGN